MLYFYVSQGTIQLLVYGHVFNRTIIIFYVSVHTNIVLPFKIAIKIKKPTNKFWRFKNNANCNH